MWAWFRLGWARSLLLAALLGGVNLAAQRYTQDTAAATSEPEFSSLGGLRAWRLTYAVPRRDGLLGISEPANTRALQQWPAANAPQSRPVLWSLGMGVFVQEPRERGGRYHSVVVVMGLDWLDDTCWVLSTSPATNLPRLSLDGLASCAPIGSVDAQTDPALARTQQEIKTLVGTAARAIVLSPGLADRALGRDWPRYVSEAWVGAGAVPAAEDIATGQPVATPHPSLDSLQASAWTVHAIRHQATPLQLQAAKARLRWQWAMAALGLAIGVLGAWGYRHVLALMVAIRRTGGAGWLPLWLDGLRLAASLGALMIAGSALVVAAYAACGASCAAPAGGALPAGAALAQLSLSAWMAWLAWPWAGLLVGLLLTASGVVLNASRRSLQSIVARGGQG